MAHAVDKVAKARAARRSMAFVRQVLRAMAAGEALADPAVVRGHAQGLLAALGVRVEHAGGPLSVAGTEPAVPATPPPGLLSGAPDTAPVGVGTLVVANHVSWLDVIALLAVEPVTMLAKREVGEWPVVGQLVQRAGTRFIDRDSMRGLPRTVDEIAELLRSGRSVMVFPQGATWCAGTTGEFRRATFQAAIDAGAPVRPVTLGYFQHHALSTVAAFVGDDDFGSSLRRIMSADGLTVRVQVQQAILPTVGDRRELAARARDAVRDADPAVDPAGGAGARVDADAAGVRGAACGRSLQVPADAICGTDFLCDADLAGGPGTRPATRHRRATPVAERRASTARGGGARSR
ncbi:lysophospholipid acyltransferase family protein [Streptomyces sp. HSW2009]|uniref:lysophospholipid acyltransferase family protein n=1 Tax=Streptomyces sp. HSW2009 TaxID=3142890 RepID=UPI0032EEA0F3